MDDTPDDFRREGRPLREWLLLLVSDDRREKCVAANAISAMWFGAPIADTTVWEHVPSDREGHEKRFVHAVSSVLIDPSFDFPIYFERVVLLQAADDEESDELSRLEDEYLDLTWDATSDETTDAADSSHASSERAAAILKRVKELSTLRLEGRLPNSFGTHTLSIILEASGEALLTFPDVARRALSTPLTSRSAERALVRIGPRAAGFASHFLRKLESLEGDDWFNAPDVLAAISTQDAVTVRRIVELAEDDREVISRSALEVLKHLGPVVPRHDPQVVDRWLARYQTRDDAWRLSIVAAFDSTRQETFERLLAIAKPGAPDLRTVPDFPEHQFDASMAQRGVAIEALKLFPQFADRAVPVLAEALDTFIEYDSDWGYESSEHGRVIASLSVMGNAALEALPALERHIVQSDGDTVDRPVTSLIARFGTRASRALGALEEAQRRLYDGGDAAALEDRTPDENVDPLRWAVWRLKGKI